MSAPPPLPGKRRNWLVLVLLLLTVLAIALGRAAWRSWSSHQPDALLAVLRKQGYAISLKELQDKYVIPDKVDPRSESFNATLKNLTLVEKLGTNYLSSTHFLNAANPSSPGQRELISQFLTANRSNLDMLSENIPGSRHRFPLEYSKGIDMPLPGFYKLKALARLHDFAAELDAEGGSTQTAASNLVMALKLSGTLVNEPLFYPELVFVTERNNTVLAFEYVLNRTPLTESELTSLRRAFEEDYNPRILERGLNYDLCEGVDIFDRVKAAQNSTNPAAVSDLLGVDVDGRFSFKSDFTFFLKAMSCNLAAEQKPYPERLAAAQSAEKEVDDTITSNNVVSGIVLPQYRNYVFKEADCNAKQAMVLTAIAIERHRLAHANQLPDKLSDLTPGLLPAVPMDPFDGQPLRYKKLPKGYLIYSIGRDRKDDGGKEWDAKKETGDLTFTVER